MFCNKCGKEISDQAKFCNFCGAQVAAAQAAAQPASQPVQQPVQQPAPPLMEQKESSKKRSYWPLIILLVACTAFVLVGSMLGNSSKSSSGTSSDVSLTASCLYGALYEDDNLTYGLARVKLPDYVLVPGEGDGEDVLVAKNGTGMLSVQKNIEIGVSFDAINSDEILNSYASADGIENTLMYEFRKYEVDGYPVVRYIVSYTFGGEDNFIGELIVFPDKNPSETLRVIMQVPGEYGPGRMSQIFDSLDISAKYALTAEDTGTLGLNQITVK